MNITQENNGFIDNSNDNQWNVELWLEANKLKPSDFATSGYIQNANLKTECAETKACIVDNPYALNDYHLESYNRVKYYGWICPRCNTVLSPFVTKCECLKPNNNQLEINFESNV